MAPKVLSKSLFHPLGGARAAQIDINAGDGNLIIDALIGGAEALASGVLEYVEKQGPPIIGHGADDGHATLSLRDGGGRQRWFRLPWAACNAATNWLVHLNPAVASQVTAHTDGGNLKLDLAGMALTGVSATTGGGNVEVVLPAAEGRVRVEAKTGSGNAVVTIPGGVVALIRAATGLGAAVIHPRFRKTGKDTYQSDGYEGAADRMEITLSSGAGNVVVNSE